MPLSSAVCKQCGADFLVKPYRVRTGTAQFAQFCSWACRAAYRAPLSERFWRFVKQTPGCWLWTGWRNSRGYGTIAIDKRGVGAHRVSWELHHGPIPDGLLVCHTCDTPACVRPDHLFLSDAAGNSADMVKKGRSLTGDRNPMRTHPDRHPRGDDHWAHRQPSRVPRGARHKNAKLTEAQVVEMRRSYASGGVTLAILAAKYGVAFGQISAIIRRKSWAHVV